GLAFGTEQVTAVWPPTGLALAALLILGADVWPGVWIGAFLANAMAHESPPVAAAIATGNTLEALCGRYAFERVAGFGVSLASVRSVRALFVAAAVSPLLSALVGVTSLCLGGVQPWHDFGGLFSLWWVGDAMGDLLFAAPILAWRRPPR